MTRVGPRMRQAVAYVQSHGPCAILPIAEAIGPHGSRKHGYAAVHRAISAGLLRAVRSRKSGHYTVTVPQ